MRGFCLGVACFTWLGVTFACVVPSALCAQELPAETVEADVSTRSVSITSGYTGTEIIIFGTVENSRQPSPEAGTYDVVVVVEGTPAPVVVRKKARVGGLWANASAIRFASFPSYYAIASTRPIDELAEASVLNKNEIGFGHVRMMPSGSARNMPSDADEIARFRDAVIRLKQRKMLSTYTSKVTMERAGLERFLHDAAYERPLLYALAAIALASLAGLAAAFAFRRILQ
jgi:uncharacterized protein (TIGR02186 family)